MPPVPPVGSLGGCSPARAAATNPVGSNFCSSCGSALPGDDHTESLPLVDTPLATGVATVVRPDDIPARAGLLIVRHGPNEGSRYVVTGTLSAGRHPDSDIFLDDITVSRHHVRFTRQAGQMTCEDLGSLNGTYVNRALLDGAAVLRTGDEVQIGKYRLVFYAARD